jgi:hypothetical protein
MPRASTPSLLGTQALHWTGWDGGANFAMVILGCCSSNVRSQAALGLLLSIHNLTPTLALSCNGWWLDPVDRACVSLWSLRHTVQCSTCIVRVPHPCGTVLRVRLNVSHERRFINDSTDLIWFIHSTNSTLSIDSDSTQSLDSLDSLDSVETPHSVHDVIIFIIRLDLIRLNRSTHFCFEETRPEAHANGT